MKMRLFALVVCVLFLGNCYAQGFLGKTISQVRVQMKEDYPDIEIVETKNNSGGKSLFQVLPDIQHIAFFNKNGICNLEKLYPLTDEAAARNVLLIKSMAYTYYYDKRAEIQIYKMRVKGKGIIKVNFLVDSKGDYVFESYYIDSRENSIE